MTRDDLKELIVEENETLKKEKIQELRAAFQYCSKPHMIEIEEEDEDSFVFAIYQPNRNCFDLRAIAEDHGVSIKRDEDNCFAVFAVV